MLFTKNISCFAILIILLLCLTGCKPTPAQSYLEPQNSANPSSTQSSPNSAAIFERANLPEHVSETVVKGNLSYEINAEVEAPQTTSFYEYGADYFDFFDGKFVDNAILSLFGENNVAAVKKEHSDLEFDRYILKEGTQESLLHIYREKNYLFYSSHLMLDGDTSFNNKYDDDETIKIGMTKDEAWALASALVAKLGFADFKPVSTDLMGKLSDDKDFYNITFSRFVDGAQVVNYYLSYTGDEVPPPDDKIYVAVGKGGVWSVYIISGALFERAGKPNSIISLDEALKQFKQIGTAKMSSFLANGVKAFVTKIQLCYVYAQGENSDSAFKLVPSWVFFCEFTENIKGVETVVYQMKIPIDASRGIIVR